MWSFLVYNKVSYNLLIPIASGRSKPMKKRRRIPVKPEIKKDLLDKVLLDNFMPFIWIGLLGLIIYFQTLFFNFVYFDDNVLILDQQYFIKDISNIIKAFGRDVFATYNTIYYRPMYTVSFILNGVIGGTHPFVYHLTNCLLHILVSCLVFSLLIKLKYERFPALLFSLVFAVLPVLTQTVAWIPGRNDVILMLFILLSFMFFLDFIEKKKIRYIILHSLLFGLAVFTKEIAVALPIICLYYLHCIVKEKIISKNKLLFIPIWILLFFSWFLLRHFNLSNPIQVALPEVFKSVFFGSPAIVQYVGKIFLPFNLAVLPTIEDTTFVYGIIACVLIIAAFVFTKKIRWEFFFLGLLWFFLFLLPSFIYPFSDTVIHYREDRLYVPVLGMFILLLESGPVKIVTAKRKIALPVFLSIICLFSVITVVYSMSFKERLVFWESAVKHSPHSPLAHRNLGAMYYFEGMKDKAEAEYRKALELNPREPMAHSNLGAIYVERNLLKEAEREFKEELEINPNFDRALFNLGLVYYRLKEFDLAIRYWKEAIRVNDMKTDAYYGLALVYHELNNEEQAQYYLGEYTKRGGKINP
jgi:tetratricopeptide (TPR) repeat protein